MRKFCVRSADGQSCCAEGKCVADVVSVMVHNFETMGGPGDRLHFRCAQHRDRLTKGGQPLQQFLTPSEQIYRDDPAAWKAAQEARNGE